MKGKLFKMQTISSKELFTALNDGTDLMLIDVREAFEHNAFNIGGTLIPFHEILNHHQIIHKNSPVVFYCEKGVRSQIAIQRLEDKFGFTNLINLTGGMSAWKKQIINNDI